jgi:GntR family transcriptional regulator
MMKSTLDGFRMDLGSHRNNGCLQNYIELMNHTLIVRQGGARYNFEVLLLPKTKPDSRTAMQTQNFFEIHSRNVRPDLPKHLQLRDTLLAAIEAGVWKQGEQLPNENALTSMTPFSLGTVQRALRSLTEDGILLRRQGAGSFVASTSRLLPYPLHCRFLNDTGDGFLPVFSKTLRRIRAKDEDAWKEQILSPRSSILRIDRQIDVGSEFLVYSRFFATADDLGSLAKCSIRQLDGQNFKQLMARELKLPITSLRNMVVAAQIPDEAAAIIKCKPGVTGLRVIAIASTAARVVYVQEFFVPPTRRMLIVDPPQSLPHRAGLVR